MKYSLLLAFALALSTLQAAVDPALLALIMPDATAVAGVNIEQGQTSPFGRFLISQAEMGTARDRVLAETGFDPLRDLREIVAGTAGQNKFVVLGRGYFQPARITSAATQKGASVTNYKGVDILAGSGNNNEGSLAFLDSNTVALGDLAAVKAVIDRRASNSSFSGDLAQRARDIAATHDAWVVANTPSNLAPFSGPNSSQARVLQTMKQLSGGVKFGSSAISFTAEATTASAQDAQSLADGLRFLVTMIPPDPKTATLLESARFSAEGPIARVSFDLPEADAEAFLGSKAGQGVPQNRQRR